MQMKSTSRGFTLVELMVAVLVVGILAAVAIPSYRSYVLRATRAEAKQALLARASDLERCYTRNNTYVNAAATPCPVAANLANAAVGIKYKIQAQTLLANTFVLQAIPVNGQQADKCGTFTMDDKNSRGVSGGTLPVQECWSR
jgi:type IV pilus assembly protein PilE